MLHATLMWTISEFLGYKNLSRWNTRAKYGCPCGFNTCSLKLNKCRMFCLMGYINGFKSQAINFVMNEDLM